MPLLQFQRVWHNTRETWWIRMRSIAMRYTALESNRNGHRVQTNVTWHTRLLQLQTFLRTAKLKDSTTTHHRYTLHTNTHNSHRMASARTRFHAEEKLRRNFVQVRCVGRATDDPSLKDGWQVILWYVRMCWTVEREYHEREKNWKCQRVSASH